MSATETKGTVLITGASAGGMGPIYADRLAKRGYDLILVARNKNRLTGLAERLKDETGRSVETIAADLSNKADLARIETTLSTNPSITLLVNNAGAGATARAQIKPVCGMPNGNWKMASGDCHRIELFLASFLGGRPDFFYRGRDA